ncbi:MAG: SDR family NAD(P)-dependent oxidoreductase [Polyangiales bacterium]
MKLEGIRVVVTGANSGIGHAILTELAKLGGTRILAVDLRVDSIPALPNVHTLVADLSTPEGTDTAIEVAEAWLGGIDLYFANAGYAHYEELGQPDWEKTRKIFHTNVLTPMYTFQKVRDAAAGKPFRVVLTASAMAYLPLPGYALYGATKASLVSFAESARFGLADPCSLTLLNPIATRTAFFKQGSSLAPTPFPSQRPEQVALRVLSALRRDKRDIFPSYLFQAMLALKPFLPWALWLYQKWQQLILAKWLRGTNAAR